MTRTRTVFNFLVEIRDEDPNCFAVLVVWAKSLSSIESYFHIYEDGNCIFEIRNLERKRYLQLLYSKNFSIDALFGAAAEEQELVAATSVLTALVGLFEQSLYFRINDAEWGKSELDRLFKEIGIN